MKTHITQPVASGWQMGLLPHDEFKKIPNPVTSLKSLVQSSGSALYPAQVPGCMELDLVNNGVLPDPYIGSNILKLQELEDRHVFYETSFHLEKQEGCRPILVFEGLDTVCDIYLNGKNLGHTDNMLIPYRFPIQDYVNEGENKLFLHFYPACVAARNHPSAPGYYTHNLSNYEMLRLRKAPHMFGWDICPRAVSAGIWRPVFIEWEPIEHIEDCYIMTCEQNGDGGTALLDVYFSLKIDSGLLHGYALKISGRCGGSEFSFLSPLRFTTGVLRVEVPNAKLWWPKNKGEPRLYQTRIELLLHERVIDVWEKEIGIRTVSLQKTGITDSRHSGQFQFLVNGEKIFLMGTNWVPLDMFHCNDAHRLQQALDMVQELGCNAIRCWGGNVYESEEFYNFCDRTGILVWQDFSMACAVYPQDEEMYQALREEILSVVRRLRNHPCLLLWAGDNECDMVMERTAGRRNPNINRLTRKLIPEILDFEDPVRPYLPSSPFYSEEAHVAGRPFVSENHLWGPRNYFKSAFYTQSPCHFVSEIGYHGCPSPSSIRRFLSPEYVWPWRDNPEWILHATNDSASPDAVYAYRIELMAKQIRELFGHVPGNLEEFSLASQISQAEAKKFFIEYFRQQRDFRTGILWWNLLDCWPQFSDAVVDYYFVKKLAYSYIQTSQQPLLLLIGEPDGWNQSLTAVNDSPCVLSFSYRLTDGESKQLLAQGEAQLSPNQKKELFSLPFSQGEKHFYLIEWESELGKGKNHYLCGLPPFDLQWYRTLASSYDLLPQEGNLP